jgi:SAM-dependent methyltransferase
VNDAALPLAPTPPPSIDWNAMAESFDRWLPHIQPVGDRLIELADISPGHAVLDVASGTGEPSLSIARRFDGRVTVLGVDAAPAMVDKAARKAAAEGLAGVSYRTMPAERLDVPSERFDRIVSRFGVMLFDDPVAGAREIWRALRPGGRVAIAVWGPIERLTSVFTLWRLLPGYLTPADRPPEPRMTSLGAPGALERVLTDAGWTGVTIEPLTVTYRFENPVAFWNLTTESGVFKDLLPKFSCHALVAFKARALADVAAYRCGDVIELPNLALIATAEKSS